MYLRLYIYNIIIALNNFSRKTRLPLLYSPLGPNFSSSELEKLKDKNEVKLLTTHLGEHPSPELIEKHNLFSEIQGIAFGLEQFMLIETIEDVLRNKIKKKEDLRTFGQGHPYGGMKNYTDFAEEARKILAPGTRSPEMVKRIEELLARMHPKADSRLLRETDLDLGEGAQMTYFDLDPSASKGGEFDEGDEEEGEC